MSDPCVRKKAHGAIVTRDDDGDIYDESVLGDVPNGYQYGYCADCKAGFRWSVLDEEWRPWPTVLGQLPLLSDAELEVLGMAVKSEQHHVAGVALGRSMQSAVGERLTVLNALFTAIQECRYGLARLDG